MLDLFLESRSSRRVGCRSKTVVAIFTSSLPNRLHDEGGAYLFFYASVARPAAGHTWNLPAGLMISSEATRPAAGKLSAFTVYEAVYPHMLHKTPYN